MSGINTYSNNPEFQERRMWFRVVDGGRDLKLDGATLVVTFISTPPVSCEEDYPLPVFAVTNGNVVIHEPVTPRGHFVWDAAADFRTSPVQSNPSADSYGHPGVWSYLGSASPVHDPAHYQLLPGYAVFPGDREQWGDPGYINLFVGRSLAEPELMVMHSYGGVSVAPPSAEAPSSHGRAR